jgi:DNA polymerase-3 subunit epsilon
MTTIPHNLDRNEVYRHRKNINDKLKSNLWSFRYVLALDDNTQDPNYNYVLKNAKKHCEKQLELEALEKFNLKSWSEVNQKPDDFKLIKRVEFSEPKRLADSVHDEITVVFLDFETTGLSHQTDKIIELGLVKLKYSPSRKCFTEIILVESVYNDPGMPIPPEITDITGIRDEDVRGKVIKPSQVNEWLGGDDTCIIAHNSKFDRPFFEQLMGQNNYRWGCSASEVDWRKVEGFRIESAKLEYILYKLGYFYEGHRASIDCLAMVQMFHVLPQALDELLRNIDENTVRIEAKGAPFSIKDKLKGAGYRWDGGAKTWWTEVPASEKDQTISELNELDSNYNHDPKNTIPLTAKDRFKL